MHGYGEFNKPRTQIYNINIQILNSKHFSREKESLRLGHSFRNKVTIKVILIVRYVNISFAIKWM